MRMPRTRGAGRGVLMVVALVVAGCGSDSAGPSVGSVVVQSSSSSSSSSSSEPAPASSDQGLASSSVPVASAPTTSPAVDAEDGVFIGFLAEVRGSDEPATISYDRIDVEELSWLPGVLDMPEMSNENQRLRLVPIANDVEVTLLCGGPLDVGSGGCEPGDPVESSVTEVRRYVTDSPYSWESARSAIRTSLPYPAVFQLEIRAGEIMAITQRTEMPETVAGWSPDLGPWMAPAIEPCCLEPGVGPVSAPFPVPGDPLPHTLYAAEPYEVKWSADRPHEVTLTLYRWVPSACIAEGWCGDSAVEVDRSTSLTYPVELDDRVFVHVASYRCLADPGPNEDFVGDGNAFAQLLLDFEADVETWLAEPVRAGGTFETGLGVAGSPFEPAPCDLPERGAPDGVASYHHPSGIDVLLQAPPVTDTGVVGPPTEFILTYSLGIDDNGVMHLFSYVGFRS